MEDRNNHNKKINFNFQQLLLLAQSWGTTVNYVTLKLFISQI